MAWNREQGYIACGGEDGMLKVLKLETQQGTCNKLCTFKVIPLKLFYNQTFFETWRNKHA